MSLPTTVFDIMTPDTVTLHEEDDVWEAEQQMTNLGLRHVPVVDGKKLVGLVTTGHIMQFSVSQRSTGSLHQTIDSERKHGTFVASVMERDVVTVAPDTPIRAAADLMGKRKIGCLPVVSSAGELQGIVTETDMMAFLVKVLPET